jgi:hypothetical protein
MMVNKKLAYGFAFGFLIVLSVFIVSAKHNAFHFWGEDPELAPFDATVQLSNVPPVIVKFIAAFEDEDSNGVDDDAGAVTVAGRILGDAGGSEGDGLKIVKLKFTVSDIDNVADSNGIDLPGGVGGPAIAVGTNIIVSITNPANNNLGNVLSASSCTTASCFGNADCNDQTSTTKERAYACDITMNYFDPRTTNAGAAAADYWTIDVQVFDSTGVNNDQKVSGNSGFNVLANDYIYYNTISSVSVPAGTTLAWTGLDINLPDRAADGGSDLIMENAGNIQINSEDVIAEDLVDDGVPANSLLGTAFSADDTIGGAAGGGSGACDVPGGGGPLTAGAQILTNDGITPVNFPIVIAYTGAGVATDRSTMFYCIYPVVNPTFLTGVTVNTYVANAANTNRWDVSFNS